MLLIFWLCTSGQVMDAVSQKPKLPQPDRRDRGNVRVIVFSRFFSVVVRAKIRGHEHRKWRLMYLVIEGFVGEVWKLKCFAIIGFCSLLQVENNMKTQQSNKRLFEQVFSISQCSFSAFIYKCYLMPIQVFMLVIV